MREHLNGFEHLCIFVSFFLFQSVSGTVRGALLARGPDSSLSEVHKGSCSGNIHMEEEKVEVKDQEDEVEDGRDK